MLEIAAADLNSSVRSGEPDRIAADLRNMATLGDASEWHEHGMAVMDTLLPLYSHHYDIDLREQADFILKHRVLPSMSPKECILMAQMHWVELLSGRMDMNVDSISILSDITQQGLFWTSLDPINIFYRL
jgi:hypothetical protein